MRVPTSRRVVCCPRWVLQTVHSFPAGLGVVVRRLTVRMHVRPTASSVRACPLPGPQEPARVPFHGPCAVGLLPYDGGECVANFILPFKGVIKTNVLRDRQPAAGVPSTALVSLTAGSRSLVLAWHTGRSKQGLTPRDVSSSSNPTRKCTVSRCCCRLVQQRVCLCLCACVCPRAHALNIAPVIVHTGAQHRTPWLKTVLATLGGFALHACAGTRTPSRTCPSTQVAVMNTGAANTPSTEAPVNGQERNKL